MSARGAVALVGLAALVVALVLGFSPVKSSGESCGSAWSPKSVSISIGEDPCGDARSSRNLLAVAFVAVGAVLLVGAAVTGHSRSESPHP